LLVASASHQDLGWPTFAVAFVALGLVMIQDSNALWETPKMVSWSVLPLVAGLFAVVAAINRAGALDASRRALADLSKLPPWEGDLGGAFAFTAISNAIDNLPSGLIAGTAVAQTHVSVALRNALLIGVDLGPNLSVTCSLATIIWLIALRRGKIKPFRATVFVQGDDVQMVELGQRARLLGEAFRKPGRLANRCWQYFQGDKAVQLSLPSFVDGAHAAAADQCEQRELRKMSASSAIAGGSNGALLSAPEIVSVVAPCCKRHPGHRPPGASAAISAPHCGHR
jgi:hypothetical protein